MVAMVSQICSRQFQRYSKGGRRVVVGCIPYRYRTGNKVEVMVITSQKGQGILFPKGGWEIGESMEEGACRETLEEAGVVGTIQERLGKWSYKSKTSEKFHEGYMYSMLVTRQLDMWQERGTRRRLWMDIETAREMCRDWWMKEALEKLIQRLASSGQQQQQQCLNSSRAML